MTVRVEFGHSRSRRYEAAVRFCRRFPRYTERVERNKTIHVVEIHSSDREAWAALMRFVGGWKSTRCFLDGREVSGITLWNLPEHPEMLSGYQPKHGDWVPDVIDVDSSPKIQRALQ